MCDKTVRNWLTPLKSAIPGKLDVIVCTLVKQGTFSFPIHCPVLDSSEEASPHSWELGWPELAH